MVKPDTGAYLNKKAGKRKLLIGIETRAGLIRSNKAALRTHGRGAEGRHTEEEGCRLAEGTAASLAETRQLK